MSGLISVVLSPYMYFENRLKSATGKRFKRFVLAAIVAVVASQTTLTLSLSMFYISAVLAGFLAWVAGAGASYLMSRWTWERKGRPRLIKETLPFWFIAACVAVVLTTTTRLASELGNNLGLTHAQSVFFVDAAFFVANCITFLIRFFIFHYLLFVDKE